VICVFDCDANKEVNLAKAFKNARENKIEICFSNPRFELWFLLHYEYADQPFTKEKLEFSHYNVIENVWFCRTSIDIYRFS